MSEQLKTISLEDPQILRPLEELRTVAEQVVSVTRAASLRQQQYAYDLSVSGRAKIDGDDSTRKLTVSWLKAPLGVDDQWEELVMFDQGQTRIQVLPNGATRTTETSSKLTLIAGIDGATFKNPDHMAFSFEDKSTTQVRTTGPDHREGVVQDSSISKYESIETAERFSQHVRFIIGCVQKSVE